MKKIHNLKPFGLLAFLAFALVFIGIDFIEGQVRTTRGKPENSPGNPDNPNKGGHKTQDRPALEDYKIMPIFHRYPVSDPQISPDGTQVLFTYTTTNITKDRYDTHIWSLSLDEKLPKQFTYGKGNDSHPRWSPNGKTILFLSDRLNGEKNQIFVMPADGGEARSLTAIEEGAQWPSWSPDGKTILFSSQVAMGENADGSDVNIVRRITYKVHSGSFIRGRRTHLFSVPSRGGKIRQLTDGEFDVESAVFSPDGSRVAFISNLEEYADLSEFRHLYTIPSKGGDPEFLWENEKVSRLYSLGWSPDGKYLAFNGLMPSATHMSPLTGLDSPVVAEEPKLASQINRGIWILPVGGGEPRNLTAEFDRAVDWALTPVPRKWSPDSKYVYFKIYNHGCIHLLRVSLEGEVEYMTEGKINVGLFGFSSDRTGSILAFTASDIMTPYELWIKDEKGMRRLTDMNRNLLRKLRLSEPEEFWFTASDGVQVQGWIIKPQGFKEGEKYPTVLQVHGGPGYNDYGFVFAASEHEFQVLADHGFAVFYTNPRGSTGYGAAFKDTAGRRGERDYQDLMEAVDYVTETYPFVDPERLGVTGGSFGGFMTNWIIGHTDRFKAAVSQRSGSRAPMAYVKNMKTPLLIIHSELDFIAPIHQAERLFVALKELKRVVEFVRFPGENHQLSRDGGPKHRVERLQHIVRWFDIYLR